METINWLMFAIACVTLAVTIGVPVWLSRQQNPKRELVYRYSVERLLGPNAQGLGLTLMHNGATLENPYLATLTVEATGRADIGSDSFDAARPLRFQISERILVDLDAPESEPRVAHLRHDSQEGSYCIPPALIKKGTSLRCRFLIENKPTITVDNPLRDIEVLPQKAYARARTISLLVTNASIVIGAASLVWLLFVVFPPVEQPWVVVVAGFMLPITVVILAFRSSKAEVQNNPQWSEGLVLQARRDAE
ncbi:hypothetical protein [Plantibacter sp. MMLR14_011]|uniref:hypothetical protein n=1 Tax=Plantibacter sp. MMLR14_011 TaxID=1898746 RepID=UPI0011134F0E|nr:hypothetical protein [Plantibacter sp. MMLR14_011]